MRRPGKGGIVLKTARSFGPVKIKGRQTPDGGEWIAHSSSGDFGVRVSILSDTLMRVTVSLRPATDLLVPFWSRDLYTISASGDPTRTSGIVEAAQRGVNSGLCFFRMEKPAFGTVLYFQNLTSLNTYFAATKTKPDGVVGGEWPELGYQPPSAPLGHSPPVEPLAKGKEVVISDAFLSFRDDSEASETESAQRFVEMIADIYPHLDKPETQHHDWPHRAQRTLRDMQKAPASVTIQYGQTYLHPYVEAEYPDSMVQLTLLASLRSYERHLGRRIPFADKLQVGLSRFHDRKLGTIRRYLPNVGKDKNRNAVDS